MIDGALGAARGTRDASWFTAQRERPRAPCSEEDLAERPRAGRNLSDARVRPGGRQSHVSSCVTTSRRNRGEAVVLARYPRSLASGMKAADRARPPMYLGRSVGPLTCGLVDSR